MKTKNKLFHYGLSLLAGMGALLCATSPAQAADKKPNIVMLMTDDTGWNDFGAYTGGGAVKNLFYDAPVDPAALLRSSDERGAGGFRPIRASF